MGIVAGGVIDIAIVVGIAVAVAKFVVLVTVI